MAEKISLILQRAIKELAKGNCEYCTCPSSFSPDSFHLDHIIPISLGGDSELENLAYSCGGCNGHKHNKTHFIDPLTGKISRLFHPRQHNWHQHFTWSEDDLLILGITSIGRTTIEPLQLNRESNLNLRRLLKMAGLHPPE